MAKGRKAGERIGFAVSRVRGRVVVFAARPLRTRLGHRSRPERRSAADWSLIIANSGARAGLRRHADEDSALEGLAGVSGV